MRGNEKRETGNVGEAAEFLRGRLKGFGPRVAVVLGTGLGGLAEKVERPIVVPYREIPGFPETGVAGHRGELVLGRLEGVPVLLQSGRFHLYEGHDPETVVLPTRVFHTLGIETLVVTNAAGGLSPTFRPPVLMLIADHVNLMFRSFLAGPVVPPEERFPDMSEPYDRALRRLAREVALAEGIGLEEGVYVGLLGPSYETPAEIRMLQRFGDAVGMSTVPEVVAARARGMRVLGISTITNLAAGISPTALSHEEVLEAGMAVAADLERLVRGVLRGIG
ncbi:MAG: purine-nucleoside phosphorylase [Gemmatimonadetes bacterium]|nr:purine-nucleoside phosphorylase [Gemmatimonadota bacterium]